MKYLVLLLIPLLIGCKGNQAIDEADILFKRKVLENLALNADTPEKEQALQELAGVEEYYRKLIESKPRISDVISATTSNSNKGLIVAIATGLMTALGGYMKLRKVISNYEDTQDKLIETPDKEECLRIVKKRKYARVAPA